jgi:lysophospholipase L1-like esterase
MPRLPSPSLSALAAYISSRVPGRRVRRRAVTLGAALVTAVTALLATSGIATGTAGASSRSPFYVALGDSYTSGPGLPAQLGPRTNPSAPAACQRSSDNYPTIVAKSLGVAVDDVSCLGASTKDLDASQGSGIPAQLSALDPSTSLVSLGIGGNDLGFSSVVANCAAVTPWGATKVGWSCRSHYTVNGVDELVSMVHQVGDRVAALLTDVRSLDPQARVFVVGYPDIVPANGRGCWPMLPFSSPDLDYVRGIEADLNDTLSHDASAAGDGYVNMATPSAAHNACTSATTRWVEPIVPSPGTFPLHPSAVGMAGMARVLEGAIAST